MRWILGAIALCLAVPAQAQYTATISGTATYADWSNSGLTGALAIYGQNVTFSATFSLDTLVYHPDPTFYSIEYWGATTDITVNGAALPNLTAAPQAYFGIGGQGGFAAGQLSLSNGASIQATPGSAGLTILFDIPDVAGLGLPANLLPYVSGSPFSIVYLGASDGIAVYDFTAASFSVTGARPPISPVPEPAAWAMLIGGLGIAGGAMRRRVSKVSFAA